MAQIGGKNSNFEKLFKDKITGLSKSLQYRTDRISNILTEAYQNPKINRKYWDNVRFKINKEYLVLERLYRTWSKINIPLAYRASMKELFTRLNRSKMIAKRAKRSYTDLVNSSKSSRIQKILVADAVVDWVSSLSLGKRNIERLLRKTNQTLLSEALINNTIVKAVETGNLMNNTFVRSINLSDTLAGQLDEMTTIINGEKYVIAGSRRFKPKYYAEMVTRVKFHEAQAQSAIMTAGNYGTSLVQISSHNTKTAICQKFEGKIFSINGKDKRFPLLADIPPFHVNCLHLLFPMFESALEVDKTLEDWADFSKGKTEKPPSPKNFVPIDERGEVA